ncbi:hypothetical protein [Mycoplasma suis]|uniref:hypothetical protein n=1 Tax=Mycoplasma suis TaxID=57372 RepID=UPI0011D1E0A5|nr:hypothetical protein [Mycoplasma suis]
MSWLEDFLRGGAASFLMKREYEGNANTLTLFKRKGSGNLGLGIPENPDLSNNPSSILSFDKEGWKHNTNNQNGNSFRITTGVQTRNLSRQGGWEAVLKKEDDPEINRNESNRQSVNTSSQEVKVDNNFHGDLTIYFGGATCQEIDQKLADLKHKDWREDEGFLSFLEANAANFLLTKDGFFKWKCQNKEDPNFNSELKLED